MTTTAFVWETLNCILRALRGEPAKGPGSGGDQIHFGRYAQRTEYIAAILPSETEGFDIGQSQPADDVGQDRFLVRRKISLEHGALRPVDQSIQTGVAVQIVAQLLGHGFARHSHSVHLNLLMAAINREFLVDLPQPAILIEYFLPKAYGVFLAVHLFTIGCTPAASPGDQAPIDAATGRGELPSAELTLVAGARCHRRRSVESPGNLMVDRIHGDPGRWSVDRRDA